MSQPQPARKPSSARRIAASRANGRLSHGPKTEAGKRRSSANNHKHGLANNRFILLPTESEAGFLDLRADFIADYHPRDAREQMLIDDLVISIWLLDRANTHCKHLIDAEIDRQDPALSPLDRATMAFSNLCLTSLAAAHRYEVKFQRRFNRALDRFLSLRESRALQNTNLPSEPNPISEQSIPKDRCRHLCPTSGSSTSSRPNPGSGIFDANTS